MHVPSSTKVHSGGPWAIMDLLDWVIIAIRTALKGSGPFRVHFDTWVLLINTQRSTMTSNKECTVTQDSSMEAFDNKGL